MDTIHKQIQSGEVTSFEAKTHLSKLLEYTSQGREFLITRRGKPIARLIPVETNQSNSLTEVLNLARAFRNQTGKTVSIISLRDKGRKH
jgi:prevent-host-death family protein